MLQEFDSGFVDAGFIPTGLQYDADLSRTDKSGDSLWLKKTDFDEDERVYALTKTNDKKYAFTGKIQIEGSGEEMTLVKTSANGVLNWNNHFGGTYNDTADSLFQAGNDNFIIAGYTNSPNDPLPVPYDVYVVKKDQSGTKFWDRTIGGAENDYGYAVCPALGNSCIIAGSTQSYGTFSHDLLLIKLDDNGNTIWIKTYGTENAETANCIQPTLDGNYFVTATRQITGGGTGNIFVLKINEDGDTLWTKTYADNLSYHANYGVPSIDGGYAIPGDCAYRPVTELDVLLINFPGYLYSF